MDQHRPICSDRRDKTALHQINDHGRQSRFNNMAADPPDYRLVQFARATHSSSKLPQTLNGENVWKRGKEILDLGVFRYRSRKIVETYFALTRRERIRSYLLETKRRHIIINRHESSTP